MLTEKKRLGVPPKSLIANGTSNGEITLSDARGFFVKQTVYLSSSTQPTLELEVKRFLSPTTFKVGLKDKPIKAYLDISAYLVADGAIISAPEQDRPGITEKEHERAVYAEEPIVAKRVIAVDEFGRYYGENNPMPVSIDGEINIENVDLDVNLDAFDTNPDNSLIVGTEDGTKNGVKHVARIDSDLNLTVKDQGVIDELVAANANLNSINNTLSNPLSIQNPIITAGIPDGDLSTPPVITVNNERLQILASHDREQEIFYADFGTKNQRVIRIEYTSPTFPGKTAIKTISYTLIGNRYRRDLIEWSVL